ncbi:MAG TPA: DUF3379 family protein [Urbifossiella sp.]|jgi:hypothetical protein|nr:DUF3379 family protein [Urbifossiella sp.]
MDCRDAQFYLRLRHPGRDEFEPEVAAALDRHLVSCPECAAAGRVLGGFDAAVASAMRAVPVPNGLRDRLFADASARRGAVLRRKSYRLAAVAASVLIVAGLAVGFYTATRPQPDLEGLAMAGDETADPRLAVEKVDRFRRAERLPVLPESLDYTLAVHTGTETVQGRNVPVILLQSRTVPGAWAKVYAFRNTGFDLKAVQDAQASHCSANHFPESEGVVYVVVFTGHDLTPFHRIRTAA